MIPIMCKFPTKPRFLRGCLVWTADGIRPWFPDIFTPAYHILSLVSPPFWRPPRRTNWAAVASRWQRMAAWIRADFTPVLLDVGTPRWCDRWFINHGKYGYIYHTPRVKLDLSTNWTREFELGYHIVRCWMNWKHQKWSYSFTSQWICLVWISMARAINNHNMIPVGILDHYPLQCGAPVRERVQLVDKSHFTRVYGGYIYIYYGL